MALIFANTDCMHVTSDEGDYAFKKVIEPSLAKRSHNLVEVVDPDMTVCGLYVVTDPDKYVEISIKYMDVDCDTGGLMAVIKTNKQNKFMRKYINFPVSQPAVATIKSIGT